MSFWLCTSKAFSLSESIHILLKLREPDLFLFVSGVLNGLRIQRSRFWQELRISGRLERNVARGSSCNPVCA